MTHCFHCGAPATTEPPVPRCPVHGPLWALVRNASAVDVLVERDGEVLLTRRAREPFRGRWELPGGMQDLGEHPADTARRELREELGVEVVLTGLLGFYLDRYEAGWCQTIVFVGGVEGRPTPGPEVLEWAWFRADQLPRASDMAWTHHLRLEHWRSFGSVPLAPDHPGLLERGPAVD